ncbi:hypothetical protein OS493_027923 [Desmophyllum pertusum]|uniref:Uncharacterized protein n=1 Tax=Desmophyllum pertusum TaxID=174260 RepID=A0A9W9YKI1_9CNID|nr:hypothetical protein OS493_027923 [Desmophyllum pertusum]
MDDLLRFSHDYHDKFEPNAYLSNYYNGTGDQVDLSSEFPLRCFHEFWCKMAKRNDARVLNFGGGPAIYDLISAAPYAEEIIFAEYTENNRQAVEAWQYKSPDSHDWLPYFKFVVQILEGKESDDVFIREAELRKKISHILPCDIGWEDPVRWPTAWDSQQGSFDVVTTSCCLEAAVKSEQEYSNAIAKMRKYLKPGGYLAMYSVLGENFYTAGKEKFHFFQVSEKLVQEILHKEGFGEVYMTSQADQTSELYDGEKLYFVSAKVQ